ncbi:hypothetical protein EVAR_60238_1 [Eumeta japonica]|uniref:Uncharacterized protein n=1 Tax=Eumeta variegata TaxID=151549 RepID=A0A4C1ZMI4_EUMVA|nr:hypothetical protein EVAR_60238_1 [Eumeta japonica]
MTGKIGSQSLPDRRGPLCGLIATRAPVFPSAGHTFDCNPAPTSVFDPSFVLRFGPGPACDSVPIRFYSSPVHNFLPHSAFNPDLATNQNSDLDEAGSKC